MPITAGIIVLAYNPDEMPAPLKLPRDVYVGHFLGKITQWDDPRIVAANPGQKMRLQAKLPSWLGRTAAAPRLLSPTTGRRVSAIGKRPRRAQIGRLAGHVMLAQETKASPGLIQRTPHHRLCRVRSRERSPLGDGDPAEQGRELSSRPAGTSGLDTLDSGQDACQSSRVHARSGRARIVSDRYLFVAAAFIENTGDENKLALLKEVLRNGVSTEGQQYSESLGYIRLPPHVITLATNALENIGP